MKLWNWLLWFLTWLSSDPRDVDQAAATASASLTLARSSLAVDAAPQPGPPAPPKPDEKCRQCNGSGWIVQPDGHRTKCPCGAAGKPACPTGNCPPESPPHRVR
jgi:hypothetical protein